MKLNAIQMLGLTAGALLSWSLYKSARRQRDDGPATLGEAVPGQQDGPWSSSLHSAARVSHYDDADADPPRNRMPSVGDLPP